MFQLRTASYLTSSAILDTVVTAMYVYTMRKVPGQETKRLPTGGTKRHIGPLFKDYTCSSG